ncbi:MAG: cytochrome c maturation protein CcmE [Candidatus Promineifilaceae bacterium]
MTQATWTNSDAVLTESRPNRTKFVIGGLVILAAVIFLVVNAMSGTTQLYLTVEEFHQQQSQLAGRDLRVSGWVLGDTIQYTQIDNQTSRLEFDIVDDFENPGQTLHIVAMNEPMPDLLQNKAQALVEGHADNGAFNAVPGGLLLKCPTRYEEGVPETAG